MNDIKRRSAMSDRALNFLKTIKPIETIKNPNTIIKIPWMDGSILVDVTMLSGGSRDKPRSITASVPSKLKMGNKAVATFTTPKQKLHLDLVCVGKFS
ncbi:hypothetical protein [Limnohabitans sp.]|uniref:hypothetical protein n=1 Tax=Limnohabitans sp. TaxID=1907725 RepID=UPI0038BC5C88